MKRRSAPLLATLFVLACAHQTTTPSERAAFARATVRSGIIEYSATGSGEPVLFIHGSIFADAFDRLVAHPALSGYRRITYHRRGFAGSDRAAAPYSIEEQAADAQALLRHLRVPRAHVVGHSYGAIIGLQLALDHPDAVASLSMLEPPIFHEAPSARELFEQIGAAAALHQRGNDDAAIEHFVQEVVGLPRQSVPAAAFQQAVNDASTFFAVEVPALQSWKLDLDSLRQLRTPVLLMTGEKSRAAFHEAQSSLSRRLGEAAVRTIEGSGHALQITHPDPVARDLAAFFAKHSASAETPSQYGKTLATAVEVCKPPGERKYLQRLRCPDGTAPAFSRRGSGGSRTTAANDAEQEKVTEQMFRQGPLAPGEKDYHIVDYYDVRCGEQETEVVMDMYHCHQPEPDQAPPGFTIVPRQ